jgi:restriction system protein
MTRAGAPEPAANFRLERRTELTALEQVLLSTPGRIAMIHGAPGSGKTGLAKRFMDAHERHFPGGQSLISAIPLELEDPLPQFTPGARSLLVIDEVDRVSIDRLTEIIRTSRLDSPLTSLLMTANTPILLSPDTFLIEMPPLSAGEVITLLGNQGHISDDRLGALVRLLAGNAEAVELASRRLASGVPVERIVEWFESGRFAPSRDPKGRPLDESSAEGTRLNLEISEVSEELIQKLSAQPDLLYSLDPRKFEQLVAELYRRRGFEATLTPASGDEGADVYVVSRDDLGRSLWVVQAKRNAPDRKIKAGVVRELMGTVTAKNASAGILITTSFFQPGAKALERQFEYRLSLKDYLDLQELLRGTGPSPR